MPPSEPAPLDPPVVSIVVPIRGETEELSALTKEIHSVLADEENQYELVFIDDVSREGTKGVYDELGERCALRLVSTDGEMGVAAQVVAGISEARGELIVVMDAASGYPIDAIPQMIARLEEDETDFVMGSRYLSGGSLPDDWGAFRRLVSRIPLPLMRPLTKLRDPLSGFFAFCRHNLPELENLRPIGSLIALEILVRGDFGKPAEIPIHAKGPHREKRGAGQHGLLDFLRHIRRLYQYKHPVPTELVQFAGVGGSGFIVDLCFYLGLQAAFGLDHRVARALSFVAAASWNWAANRTITFDKRPKTSKLKQWPAFLMTSISHQLGLLHAADGVRALLRPGSRPGVDARGSRRYGLQLHRGANLRLQACQRDGRKRESIVGGS